MSRKDDYPPPAGHTDELGYWHWGTPEARLEAIQKEKNRRWWAGQEKVIREKAAAKKERGQEREREV